MAPRRIESDDSSNSDSDSPSSSPIKPSKDPRLPSVDFSTDVPTVRQRKKTTKIAELDQRASEKKDAEIAALKKKMKALSKRHEATTSELREHKGRMDAESEEENGEPVQMSSFPSSFKSKGIAGTTAQKPPPVKKLRKSTETPITTPMAARAPFLDVTGDLNAGPGGSQDIEPAGPSDNEASHAEALNTRTPLLVPTRKHGRTPSPSRKSRKRRRVAEELPKAQFVAGHPPTGSRTNLNHYTEPARKLLKNTMHRYEVRIWTINVYPAAEIQMQWVKEIWDEVCTEAEEQMELTERMASMIMKYGSHARSSFKDAVRPLVAPTYSFKVGDSDKILRKNSKLWKVLINDSAFHYANTTDLTGYAGNPIIMESMRVIWFKTKGSRGIVYGKSFSPISLVTLALIFTAIEFCIDEYSTGRFQQGVFDEVVNTSRYEVHLKDLTEWAALKPSVTDTIRQRMHDKLRSSTGSALLKSTGRLSDVNRARALEELEAMEAGGADEATAADSDPED
ncbi:hypothetical protein C8R43DRAFT_1138623 [Mycena crocata]|nr:hypothetical protein C8R43DRAFT_1138623 [Mycena crocata]